MDPGSEVPGPETLHEGVAQFAQTFDQERGGFGDAPKFPRPSELLFLMRETARTGDFTPALMVAKTLQAMSFGGMRDHVGGGFHRYSVDGEWRVPHFEKMLYDQAQITLACLEAFQLARRRVLCGGRGGHAAVRPARDDEPRRRLLFGRGRRQRAARRRERARTRTRRKARSTCGRRPSWSGLLGGRRRDRSRFGSASGPTETRRRIRKGSSPARICSTSPARSRSWSARAANRVDEIEDVLRRSRMTLFEARLTRPRPHLDDKVLTAWNGLMLAAFARAARVMPLAEQRSRYLEGRDDRHGFSKSACGIPRAGF